MQRLVGEQLISAGHAKALLGHPDRSYQEALAKNSGVISLDGKMIDKPIVERAERVLAYAEAASAR